MTNDEKTAVMAGQLDGWASSLVQPEVELQTPAERTLDRLRNTLKCDPTETVEARAKSLMAMFGRLAEASYRNTMDLSRLRAVLGCGPAQTVEERAVEVMEHLADMRDELAEASAEIDDARAHTVRIGVDREVADLRAELEQALNGETKRHELGDELLYLRGFRDGVMRGEQ